MRRETEKENLCSSSQPAAIVNLINILQFSIFSIVDSDNICYTLEKYTNRFYALPLNKITILSETKDSKFNSHDIFYSMMMPIFINTQKPISKDTFLEMSKLVVKSQTQLS